MSSAGDVAVVGMAGRFPGAASVAELWQRLRAGERCIATFGEEELLRAGAAPEELAQESYVPAWGWLEGIELFDAPFFGVGAREAELTDPQVRLLLETAWEALEDAGCDPSRFPGRIGVFAGTSRMSYLWEHVLPTPGLVASVGAVQTWVVNDRDFAATRVNYKLGLRGPGIDVQTACSTSLVAVHLGIQSLLGGESDLVLCGASSITHNETLGYSFVEGGILSPDGHVRAFDARASGMVGGNGVALVALRRLEDALRDGDPVRAVIKATAINNDGLDKVAFTAPSVDGQAQVILDALDLSGVDPATIGYVEAHGTGTPMGDPIEVAALTQAWKRAARAPLRRARIGTLKPNVGHLDSTAGVAGLVKAVLCVEHGEVPPNVDFETPNPLIDFASVPFEVPTALAPWEEPDGPRRAAVSSLGMGGTNAHAIVEQAPPLASSAPARAPQLLVVSARSAEALERARQRLADALEGSAAGHPLADVAATCQLGRKAFEHRACAVARDHAEAARLLRAPAPGGGVVARGAPRTVFLFPGQGAQHPGMLAGLYRGEPRFRAELDRSAALLEPHLGRDLRALLYPAEGAGEEAASELARTRWAQPALFAVELALARLLESWGVVPDAMLGHSVGELVAATLAGVFRPEDAHALVAARGRLMDELPAGGGMLALGLPEVEARALLPPELSLAAVNAPELVVASGPLAALEVLERALEARGVATRRLRTSHAFHSALLEPALGPFARVLEGLELRAPERALVSCATGRTLTADQARDPCYWVAQARGTVRFADGVAALLGEHRAWIEVGPGDALASLTRLAGPPPGTTIVSAGRHPRDERDDQAVLLEAAGGLWRAGCALDWEALHGPDTRRRVSLPSYPFERRRYWIERPRGAALAGGGAAPRARLADLADWFHVPSWKRAAPRVAGGEGPERWLVVSDGGALARGLVARLEREGAPVASVVPGEAFAREGRELRVAAAQAGSWERVLAAVAEGAAAGELAVVLALPPPADHGALERRYHELSALARALASRAPAPTRLVLLTRGMHDPLGPADGSGAAAPEQALFVGPCMALAAEVEGARAVVLDLAPDEEPAPEALLAELCAPARDPVVALRGGARWALCHEPLRLPPASGTAPLREGAVVLVTGGLGGIGLALAEELARAARARLALLGRSALPAPGERERWLAEHAEDDPTSERLRAVRRLEELGSEVLCLAADCADRGALEAALGEVRRRFGAIEGLVHAAGVAGGGVLALATPERARAVLAPKVDGARHLRALLAGEPLAFVLLCSSISAVVEGFGQADYFAANAWLDAVAPGWARASGAPVVSVAWDTWREVGMAARGAVPAELAADRRERLRLGIAPAEGREAFRRVLAAGLPRVVVSATELRSRADWRARFEPGERATEGAPERPAEAPAAAPRAASPRPELERPYEAPLPGAEETVAAIWADLLGLERVGRGDDFFELGGNSLVMMQINVRLRTSFGLSLPIRSLFENPEVRLQAACLQAVLGQAGLEAGPDGQEWEVFRL